MTRPGDSGRKVEAIVPLVDSIAVTVLSYLRFSLSPGSDLEDFERDLSAMLDQAKLQAGYRWAEMGPSLASALVYLVISEWDEIGHVRAWEHEEEHSGVMQKWETRYAEPFLHRRFVPSERPRP